MVRIETDFRRSDKHEDECQELIEFARSKLDEAIEETEYRDREVAFGALITDDEVYITENYIGNANSVPIDIIESIDSELDRIVEEKGSGRRCLIHTHDGDPLPSRADVFTFVASLGNQDEILDRVGVPDFDCYFIIGRINDDEGQIIGWITKERPDRLDYAGLVSEFLFKYESNKIVKSMGRANMVSDVLSMFDEYVDPCERLFKLRS